MKKLEKFIKDKGFKQIEVARVIGLDKQGFYSRCRTFDKGIFPFSNEELKKISEFMKIEPKEILEIFL